MNEITRIHLGRQPFTIAVDAHRKLRAYLEEIEKQVGGDKDVLEEVESRMAELLTERGISASKVILIKDVAFLKEQLGEPGDFGDEDEHKRSESKDDDDASKRLFRDPEHGMIAGVAAGIGAYLHVDPLIVRLVFVLLTFAGGAGVLVYVLLWLLVPPVKSGSDRLQMNGKAVTVDNIKQVIDKADVSGVARRASSVVGRFGVCIAKIVVGIVGVGLILWGIALLLGAVTVAAYGALHGAQLGGKTLFPVSTRDYVVMFSGFAVLLVFALLSIFGGRAMIRRKWGVSGWALAGLAALFITAGGVGTATGFAVAPDVRQRYASVQHVEWRGLPPFTSVQGNLGNIKVLEIAGAPDNGLELHTVGNTNTEAIKASVKNGVLTIDATKYHANTANCFLVCPDGPENVEIFIHSTDWFTLDINTTYGGTSAIILPPGAPAADTPQPAAPENAATN